MITHTRLSTSQKDIFFHTVAWTGSGKTQTWGVGSGQQHDSPLYPFRDQEQYFSDGLVLTTPDPWIRQGSELRVQETLPPEEG